VATGAAAVVGRAGWVRALAGGRSAGAGADPARLRGGAGRVAGLPGLLLAGAALTAAVVAWRVPSQPAYVLAASWALVGALVSTAGAGATVLAVVAVAGLAVVAGTAVTSVVRRPS
jgi:hypothetical protein